MLKNANTYPLQQLSGKSYPCACGREHVISTREIIFCEEPLPLLTEAAAKHIAKGIKIMMVCGRECFDKIGFRVEKEFNRAGFIVVPVILDGVAPDVSEAEKLTVTEEGVKAIMAVGDTCTADLVKYAGARLKLPVIVYGTGLYAEGYLSPSAYLKSEGYWEIYSVPPARIFAMDCKCILDAGETERAAAVGSAAAKNIALFDWFFSHKMTGETYCPTIAELCECEIDACFSASNGAREGDAVSLIKIAECGVRLSWLTQAAGNSRLSCGGETHTAHALDMLFTHEEREKRTAGENVFLCAGMLADFYAGQLAATAKDFLAPPDNSSRLTAITECFGVSESAALRKIHRCYNDADTKVFEHKLSEYRQEFAGELKKRGDSLRRFVRVFRRIYKDCGFWMKGYLDPQDFCLLLSLAPDIREKYTFLLYLKQTGRLEKYLNYYT